MAEKKPMPPKKPMAAKPAPKPAAKPAPKAAAPKMTDAQRYNALRQATQRAGMNVMEKNGKIFVQPKGK